MFPFLSLLLICFSSSFIESHVVWEHPIPRYSGDDRLKGYPCGDAQQYNLYNSTSFTLLTPGYQALSFVETIPHAGAPIRVAFSFRNDDNYDKWVLLDHFPHYTSGKARYKYRIGVVIPNVACDRSTQCSLQIIQVMTDKFSTPCLNPSGIPMQCGAAGRMYYSCANIRINGTISPDQLSSIYNSTITTSTADSRAPYSPGLDSPAFTQGSDGRYSLPNTPLLVNVPEEPTTPPTATAKSESKALVSPLPYAHIFIIICSLLNFIM